MAITAPRVTLRSSASRAERAGRSPATSSEIGGSAWARASPSAAARRSGPMHHGPDTDADEPGMDVAHHRPEQRGHLGRASVASATRRTVMTSAPSCGATWSAMRRARSSRRIGSARMSSANRSVRDVTKAVRRTHQPVRVTAPMTRPTMIRTAATVRRTGRVSRPEVVRSMHRRGRCRASFVRPDAVTRGPATLPPVRWEGCVVHRLVPPRRPLPDLCGTGTSVRKGSCSAR